MEGVWKFNPFYWLGLQRLSHSQRIHQNGCKSKSIYNRSPRPQREGINWHNFNPLRWSRRAIHVFVFGFFATMLPVYAIIGAQPTIPIEAASYPTLAIPSIQLNTPVEPLELVDHQLVTPQTIAGAYQQNPHKTLIIGHSSSVFQKLNQLSLGEIIEYQGLNYIITAISVPLKTEIDMSEILASTNLDTLILMTCAGEPLPNQDATHRLIVTATATQ